MPSVLVRSVSTPIANNTALSILGQNIGQYPIYISSDGNLTADTNSIVVPAGTSFTWAAGVPLFAICAIGGISQLTYATTGATLGQTGALTALNSPQYLNAPAPNTLYSSLYSHQAGLYTITCPSSTIATLFFYYQGNLVTSVQTSAGSVIANVATQADEIRYYTNTGTNIQIVVTLTGNNLPYLSAIFTLDISALDSTNVLG